MNCIGIDVSSWIFMSKGKLIGCSRVLRHGSEPATFRNRRGKYRKRSAGLGTVPCRAGAVSSGIAYVDFNGFYYFRRAIRYRAASVPIPVEIGLYSSQFLVLWVTQQNHSLSFIVDLWRCVTSRLVSELKLTTQEWQCWLKFQYTINRHLFLSDSQWALGDDYRKIVYLDNQDKANKTYRLHIQPITL